MVALKNINFMSQERYDSVTTTDDDLYAVEVNWVAPNYANGITLSENIETYTAPSDGLFVTFGEIQSRNVEKIVLINGKPIAYIKGWTGDYAGTSYDVKIEMHKGDVLTNLYNAGAKYFYPY